ncbi:MAG: phosphoribosylformylglycinamidine synthase, partial [Spirochaetes bacterium]|nr:phosphoribosylformylglycinamidine synthase [Spirochaetota bacterium]
DTAVRNAIAAGGRLGSLAILDNFCWCDSNNPERLGQLREAARACYEYAVAYGTPFISGKDSMFNDFRGYDENFNEVFISIPPTLLVSSIGVVEDIRACQTIDFKVPGDLIYAAGMTGDEMGGSEYLACMGERLSGKRYIGDTAPKVSAEDNIRTYRAMENALAKGLVASCASIERGGLGVALAKSALAGMLGVTADLSKVPARINNARNDTILFSESQGRLLLSVDPSRRAEFEDAFRGVPLGLIGHVTGEPVVVLTGTQGSETVRAHLDSLMKSYKGVFKDF